MFLILKTHKITSIQILFLKYINLVKTYKFHKMVNLELEKYTFS